MKKLCLLVTAIFFLSFSVTQAQFGIRKGTIITGMTSTINMGGAWGSELMSIGFLSSNNDYKERIFNVMPSGGYFIIDNLAVIVKGLYSSYAEESKLSDESYSQRMWGIGPFTRYYLNLGSIFVIMEGGVIIARDKDTYSYTGDDFEDIYNGMIIEILGGVSKQINQVISLDAQLGYSRAAWTPKDGVDEIGKDVCQGLIAKVGFTVYLDLSPIRE